MRVVLMLLLLLLLAGCAKESVVSDNNSDEVDCPFGNVDCPYPGQCGRYVDTDGNKICDNSE